MFTSDKRFLHVSHMKLGIRLLKFITKENEVYEVIKTENVFLKFQAITCHYPSDTLKGGILKNIQNLIGGDDNTILKYDIYIDFVRSNCKTGLHFFIVIYFCIQFLHS